MIKNQKQANLTSRKLEELILEKEQFVAANKERLDSAKARLTLNGYDGLIDDLKLDLKQYEQLSSGLINCLQKELGGLPEMLIAARIAQKISHRELADRLGLKEQQIQRYEANDYEGISFDRIKEVAFVLGLNCRFEKTWLMNVGAPMQFGLPQGISSTTAEEMTAVVKASGSILIQ